MADEVDYEEDVEVMNTEKPIAAESSGYKVEAPSDEPEDRKKKTKVKGRGHERRQEDNDRYDGRGGVFERIEQSSGSGPLQCNFDFYSFKYFILMFGVLSYRRMDCHCQQHTP